MTKHNKKRNVGIVYELLLNYISNSLIENKKNNARKATRIIEKHFRKGTELYKEFRLVNALAKSKVSSSHNIASILSEAKTVINNLDHSQIEKEKSDLIRHINYSLGKSFYRTSVANYRDLGNIQLAINEWKKEEKDLKNLIEYETKIAEMMLKEEVEIEQKELNASHADKLVLKIMTEKFNKRYAEELSGDQKKIIENYVFYSDKNEDYLIEFFKNKKQEALSNLSAFENCTKNNYLLEKVDSVKNKITGLDHNSINDDTVIKFLSVTKLIKELKKGE
jgi:hypothetical protein